MAKDKVHEIVRIALEKDGWLITHDPYALKTNPGQGIDIGAEKLIIAQRDKIKIAVEVKSFLTASKIYKFYEALGQYINYKIGLRIQEPERELYLAIPEKIYYKLMEYTTVPDALAEANVKVIVVDLLTETIVSWKHD